MSVAIRSIFLFIYTVSQVTCNGRNKTKSTGHYSGLTCHTRRCPVPGRPHQAEGDDACGQHLQVPVPRAVCRAPVQSCLQGADSSDLYTIYRIIYYNISLFLSRTPGTVPSWSWAAPRLTFPATPPRSACTPSVAADTGWGGCRHWSSSNMTSEQPLSPLTRPSCIWKRLSIFKNLL